MQEEQFFYIPKKLNEPYQIVIFTLDEVVVISICFISFFLAGYMLVGLLAAAGANIFYRRFKAGRPRDYFKRKLFWWGISLSRHGNLKNQLFYKGSGGF